MDDPYEFPTALEDGKFENGQGDALRWTVKVIALSTLGLALLNPGAITSWVADLAPSPTTVRLATVTDAWEGAMMRIGLGSGHAGMHAAWRAAERTDWSGRQPVQMAADTAEPRS